MTHCISCRYWEEPELPSLDGLAICLKRTCATLDTGIVVVRTRGDDSCDKFRPLTVDNLLQTRESNRR